MSRHTQRAFFSNNGTLQDVTIQTNDYRRDSFIFDQVSAEDYLYVGTDWAFNTLHFDLSVPNDQASTVSVELWDGENWKASTSVLDYTSLVGVSFARSGHITWDRDRDESFTYESESKDIPELSTGPDIRGFYWVRFKWSNDFNALTEINHIGLKFSDDNALYTFYPEFNNSIMQARWQTGKSDWNEQSFMAADVLIRDLKKTNVIDFRGQILDFELFREAAIHKTAEIIFAGLGNARRPEKLDALASYLEAKNMKQSSIDRDGDANLSKAEKVHNHGFMTR